MWNLLTIILNSAVGGNGKVDNPTLDNEADREDSGDEKDEDEVPAEGAATAGLSSITPGKCYS